MTISQNSEIMKKLLEVFKKSIPEGVPTQLSNVIAPVVDVSPERRLKIAYSSISDSASGTIITTSSVKRTYFCGASLTLTKDVNATSINTYIALTPKDTNTLTYPHNIRYEPLTAGSYTYAYMLPIPIELKKGTTITLNNSAAVASIDASAAIYYYELDEN